MWAEAPAESGGAAGGARIEPFFNVTSVSPRTTVGETVDPELFTVDAETRVDAVRANDTGGPPLMQIVVTMAVWRAESRERIFDEFDILTHEVVFIVEMVFLPGEIEFRLVDSWVEDASWE